MNRIEKEIGKEFWDFIHEHRSEDPSRLKLKFGSRSLGFDLNFALVQIEARKKYMHKLGIFLRHDEFLFPDSISGEQSSHQAVSIYHASLVEPGKRILDLTGGLGIDALTFALVNQKMKVLELDSNKADMLSYNAGILGVEDFEVINGDSIAILKETKETFDVIFVDPSRRDTNWKRVYNLRDCGPDVVENQELLLEKSQRVMIKASPLLDVTQTLRDFKNISSMRAVGVKGECKEILVELKRDFSDTPVFEAVNLDEKGKILNVFRFEKDSGCEIQYIDTKEGFEGKYLLEPSAMIMKFGPWSELCKRFNAKKMGQSSHLFVSETFPENFSGRVTRIKHVLKKQDRKTLEGLPAGVVSRNYPLSSDEVRRQFRLKEGDKNFIYCTRIGEKPVMFLTETLSKNDSPPTKSPDC